MENINYLNDFQISLIEILNELKSDKQRLQKSKTSVPDASRMITRQRYLEKKVNIFNNSLNKKNMIENG